MEWWLASTGVFRHWALDFAGLKPGGGFRWDLADSKMLKKGA